MLSGLLKMSGIVILRIVYGKDKWKTKSQNFELSVGLSILFMFWLICLIILFADSAANDFWLCLIYGLGFPVAILVWTIIVRKSNK